MQTEFACETAATRLDRFLSDSLPELSRSRLQALIRSGHITLNGQPAKPSDPLSPGDRIRIDIPPPKPLDDIRPADIALDILYEDPDLIVINKAPDMVVHPGAGTGEDTLVHALLHHCHDLSGIGGTLRPGIVHRLDKETSGCLIAAKNDEAHAFLAEQFAGRHVEKTYLAIVRGTPHRPRGSISAAIARHPVHRQKMAVSERPDARAATTDYQVLLSRDGLSLIECLPRTGRTHQIRVHLKHLGFPILGDPVYGHRNNFSRHFLHAWKIAFLLPSTRQPVHFTAPVPADFPLHPPPAP